METLLQLLKEQTIQIEDHKNTVHHLNKQIQELSQAKQKQMEEIQLTKNQTQKYAQIIKSSRNDLTSAIQNIRREWKMTTSLDDVLKHLNKLSANENF